MPGSPKRLVTAIGYAFLAPMVIAPLAWVVMLSLGRLFPRLGALPVDAAYRVFNVLIPGGTYKGLFLPILELVAPAIFVGDLGAAVFTWRVLRSKPLAGLTLATALFAQLIGVAAACVLFQLADHVG